MTKNSFEQEKNDLAMPVKMSVGPPTLKVKDIDGTLAFYRDILGLERVASHGDGGFALGFAGKASEQPLLILRHDANARRAPERSAGLFHIAITVPDRRSLAQAYTSLAGDGVRFDGLTDHIVAESLYLHDPESNGIEIYRDRPRSFWFDADGNWKMGGGPLDLEGVLGELDAPAREADSTSTGRGGAFPNGAIMGHLHLRVTDLERSTRFYHEKLGLDVSIDMSENGVMFLSTGGYHHRIALNTWYSLGGRGHQTLDLGLDSFVLNIPEDGYSKEFLNGLKLRLEDGKLNHDKNEFSVLDPDGLGVKIVMTERGRA
jgi:catechol 2,3-dioxygenase